MSEAAKKQSFAQERILLELNNDLTQKVEHLNCLLQKNEVELCNLKRRYVVTVLYLSILIERRIYQKLSKIRK